MKIRLIFLERGLETFFGVKPENYNHYFCSSADGNNKTSHLLKSLMSSGTWISTDDGLGGIITLEKQLEVSGKAEKWFIEKMKEFEFLNGWGYHGTNS